MLKKNPISTLNMVVSNLLFYEINGCKSLKLSSLIICQSFTQEIVHVVSAYETQLFTNSEKKQRGCSVTHQFSLPNSGTFLFFVVTLKSKLLHLRKINWDNVQPEARKINKSNDLSRYPMWPTDRVNNRNNYLDHFVTYTVHEVLFKIT